MTRGSNGSRPSACSRRTFAAGACIVAAVLAGAGRSRAQSPSPSSSTSADPSSSDEVKKVCAKSYEDSQLFRQQGELLATREALLQCARLECPVIARSDCLQWLSEVEKAIPTVILQATVDGVDRFDVAVSIDGKKLTDRLEGKARPLDPGAHVFRFEVKGFPPQEVPLVIREGEQYRAVKAVFESPKAAPVATATIRPIPNGVWILGGAALVGAGGFAAFGLLGNHEKSKDQAACAPFCPSSKVDAVKRDYLIADVSLGVGVAALLAGSILYFARPEVTVSVDAAPTTGGLSFALSGSF